MKQITKRAKADYFSGYIGQMYTRTFKFLLSDEPKTVGPYDMKYDYLNTIDRFIPQSFGITTTIIEACDTLKLREINNLFGDELKQFAHIITGGLFNDEAIIRRNMEYDDIISRGLGLRIRANCDVKLLTNFYKGGIQGVRPLSTKSTKHAFDYLREIGVATPYYDAQKMIEYSVDELIENRTIIV